MLLHIPAILYDIIILLCIILFYRYTEVANNVQTQETILNIQFVLLDCSPLKFAILGHCQEWQKKFTNLLYEIATAKLKEIHEFMKSNAEKWVIFLNFTDSVDFQVSFGR